MYGVYKSNGILNPAQVRNAKFFMLLKVLFFSFTIMLAPADFEEDETVAYSFPN